MQTKPCYIDLRELVDLADLARTCCDKPDDRMWHHEDNSWWKRVGNSWVIADAPKHWEHKP